ncbi:3-oxo-5-alpha-steroid 4-dehydrogenase [Xylariaceae sp. FL0255]|nr:3-oxo-5-alpha-steroid 4-dehydrogenase [Xylariaceae sp. FL0255]
MIIISLIRNHVEDLTPATICQLFYIAGALAVLGIAGTPASLRRLLTQYGARNPDTGNDIKSFSGKSSTDSFNRKPLQTDEGLLVRLVTQATSVGNVPHSWFIHFYILSLSCTFFWAFQFLSNGAVLQYIVTSQAASSQSSMTICQVILVWLLMGLQAGRRLFEYLTILRPSPSRMWIVHWLLGHAFYVCTSISIWVEGSRSVWQRDRDISYAELSSLRSLLAVLVFLTAWYMQYRSHRYLASLKKYSLPQAGLFRYLVCPHYTCECLIYLSMAVLAAPQGEPYNKTLACAAVFVMANLGVTASGTKQWYCEKFESQADGKWRMVPFIF